MTLPSFLGPFTAVPVQPSHNYGYIGGGAAKNLGFTMQAQQQTE